MGGQEWRAGDTYDEGLIRIIVVEYRAVRNRDSVDSRYRGCPMDLTRKKIGAMLGLAEEHIAIDRATYDPAYPNDIKAFKSLAKDDSDFKNHIADYQVYPDYALAKIVNQGIRLLISLLYPKLKGIPVGMIEHIKLRGLLYPGDQMTVVIKKWQDRSKIAKFEVGVENQKGLLVYESTIYGTLVERQG